MHFPLDFAEEEADEQDPWHAGGADPWSDSSPTGPVLTGGAPTGSLAQQIAEQNLQLEAARLDLATLFSQQREMAVKGSEVVLPLTEEAGLAETRVAESFVISTPPPAARQAEKVPVEQSWYKQYLTEVPRNSTQSWYQQYLTTTAHHDTTTTAQHDDDTQHNTTQRRQTKRKHNNNRLTTATNH